jgi:hypothetical protein
MKKKLPRMKTYILYFNGDIYTVVRARSLQNAKRQVMKYGSKESERIKSGDFRFRRIE